MTATHGQIVYFGLSRLTEDRTVIRAAYQYWQDRFINQPFDVVDVANALIEFIGSDSSGKKTLMIALHAANNRSANELPDVPGFVVGDQGSVISGLDTNDVNRPSESNEPHESNLPAYCDITEQFFKAMLDRLRQVDSSAYTEVVEIIAEEGLDDTPQFLHSMIIASPDEGLKLTSKVSEQQCQALAHSLCILVTEVVGPILADDTIDNTISLLLQSSKAKLYDPRKLL